MHFSVKFFFKINIKYSQIILIDANGLNKLIVNKEQFKRKWPYILTHTFVNPISVLFSL